MVTLRAIVLLTLFFPAAAFSQQDYVGRFDIYNGFTWFDSPSAKLKENGYHLQAGLNVRTWLALGFDYSVVTGDITLTPDLLKPALAAQIAAQLQLLQAAGIIPAGYQLALRTGSTTDTFAAGPQLEFRRFRHVTLFVRPSIGAIYESAVPHPADPVATQIVAQLAPSGKKTDWQAFYGAGGGADFKFTKHFSLRVQIDVVHNDLFTDILKNARNTVRLSIGPSFGFGSNIMR